MDLSASRCYLGAELLLDYNEIYFGAAALSSYNPQNHSYNYLKGVLTAAQWCVGDGASTPGQEVLRDNYTPDSGHVYADVLCRFPSGYDAIFWSGEYYTDTFPPKIYTAQNATTNFGPSPGIYTQWVFSETQTIVRQPPQKFYNFILTTQNPGPFLCLCNDGGGAVTPTSITTRECAPLLLVEFPNNMELVSYNRVRTAPTTVDYKTLDGAIRRYITGPATTSVSATWRWSDDGSVAKKLDEQILTTAKELASPLVLYVPAGIYFNGPFIDLVIPTNDPHPVMVAPGTYELTLEGSCQP